MFIRSAASTMLAIEIAIHVYLAPDHLEEMPYIGVSFVIGSALCAVALVLVMGDRPAGWLLGAALCAGMAGAFVVSRALGLPDYHEAWTSDHSLGLWSLPPEVLFVWLASVRLRSAVAANGLLSSHLALVATAGSSSGVPHPGHAPRGVADASWTNK